MMNNINKFKLSYLFFGICIILYILYIRLIMIRLPKDLWIYFDEDIKYNLLFALIISIIVFSNMFIINILLLYKIELKVNPLLGNLLLKIKDTIDKALLEVYLLSETFESDGYNNMARRATKFYSMFGHITETFFINLKFSVRVLVVIIFLIDVFYFFRLNYFYKSLILLCIPIVVNVWFYMLKDFAVNFEDAKKVLLITEEGTDEKTGLPITNFSRNPENEENLDLKYYVEQYILLSKINGYLQIYTVYSNYLQVRFDIVISFLYLVGWFYVIYMNLWTL